MDESILEITEYRGEGFKPLVFFGAWRVAVLRYLDELHPERIARMERHMETDEVFVLQEGRAVLLMGGKDPRVEAVAPQVMEIGRLYNVRCTAWHSVIMSREATILLVENHDTGDANSEYVELTRDQRRQVVEVARSELPEFFG